MKKGRALLIAAVFFLATVLLLTLTTGCNLVQQDGEFGEMKISFLTYNNTNTSGRGSESNLDKIITDYEIDIVHQASGTEKHISVDKSEGSCTFENLMPGIWDISVAGLNSDSIVVGEGSAQVTVLANQTTETSITLVRADGSGQVDVAVSWTENIIENPAIGATAVSMDDDSEVPITMNIGADNASATGTTTLEDGYYMVKVILNDQDSDFTDGRIDLIQVLSEGTTPVDFTIPLPLGSLNLGIFDPDDLSLFGIELSEVPDKAAVGTNVTISLEGEFDPDQIIWYENSVPLEGESGTSVTIPVDEYKNYSITCIVTKDGKSDSATVNFSGTDIDRETSHDKYLEARSLMQQMLGDVGSSPVVNADAVYSLLNDAVAMDSQNTDAMLSLSFFDIMKFLLDDEIKAVMQDGFGFSEYPETLQELYADMLVYVTGSLVPNGFNNFWEEYEIPNSYSFAAPLLSGYSTEEGAEPPNDYLYQMFSNLADSGYDLDDVFDGILDSLGRSFERTMQNVDALEEGGRFVITSETGPMAFVPQEVSYCFSTAEAKVLLSQLYLLRSLANLFNGIELGFDTGDVLESIRVSVEDGTVDMPDTSPFADGFLQADSEEAAAYVEAAKSDILQANTLYREAIAEISSRGQNDNDDSDLYLNPENTMVFDDDSSSGWSDTDPMSWNEMLDVIQTLNIWFEKDHASITAGGGTKTVVPIDLMEYVTFDDVTDEPDVSGIFAEYSDPANWPSDADMDLDTGLNAVAYDLGALYSQEMNLLAALLEVDASGEPTMYYYDEGTDSFSEAASYISGQYAYVKIPDVTFGGVIDKNNSPYTWAELEQMLEDSNPPFTQDVLGIVDNPDTGTLEVFVLEQVFNGTSWGVPYYPFSYHVLTPAETASTTVDIKFGTRFDNVYTGNQYVTESTMDISSTGSFWLGFIEYINLIIDYDDYNNYYLLDYNGSLNDSQSTAYQLEKNISMDFHWDDEETPPSNAWFKITPEETGDYCIEADLYGTSSAVLIYPESTSVQLNEKNYVSLSEGETYFVHYEIDTTSDWVSYDILWYLEDAQATAESQNYSRETGYPMESGTVYTGMTLGHKDYYSVTPQSDEITVTIEFPPDKGFSWQNGYISVYVYNEESDYYNYVSYEDFYNYDEFDMVFGVTPGKTYSIGYDNWDGLEYSISWSDTGTSEPL